MPLWDRFLIGFCYGKWRQVGTEIGQKPMPTWKRLILMVFGVQVGREDEPRSIQKGIEKTMQKGRALRWPKMWQQEPAIHRGRRFPGLPTCPHVGTKN